MSKLIEYCFIENWRVMMLLLPLIVVFGKEFAKQIAIITGHPFIYLFPIFIEIFILFNFAYYVLFDTSQQVSGKVIFDAIPQYLMSFTVYFAFSQLFSRIISTKDELFEITEKSNERHL